MSAKPHSKVLRSSDGCEIYAEATGHSSRPHVVLIHGVTFSGAVFDDFCRQPELLEELYIVRYDLRGHGRSGMPDSPESHQSKLYADDFMAVVRGFKLSKPVLVGWSKGGTIAVDICANVDPLPISGIFYLSSALSVPRLFAGSGTSHFMSLVMACTDPVTTPAGLLGVVDATFCAPRKPAPPFQLRCMWAGMQAMQTALVRGAIFRRTQDSRKLLEKLEEGLPVYVYYGSHDLLTVGKELEKDLAGKAKDVEVEFVEGAGHALFWEDPEETARVIIRFVKKVQMKRA
ncbi:hypothetical protein EW146_g3464 [Bondarzewia mesenterica]|uniref:AB hydrolase-1 domain-containing protein n=1 Tax=Bondarzewia mesenterica TaxID=1095465 RepID=A0A4S4LZP4_9AGAM|nr:hypothetical protein EW146_g3464 [Bondarzewia mesenterica]